VITIKSADEIGRMRQASRIVGETLLELGRRVKPGVTTGELDRVAHDVLVRRGCVPAFLGYHGYPATICASVNEEVVHGIPGNRVLEEGEIVGIDLGAFYEGYCGDSARTFPVGRVSEAATKLLAVTWEGLNRAIAACRPGSHIGDIGHAVQSYVEGQGCSIVKDYVGHGIGSEMHEEPQVPNYGVPGGGPRLEAGMTLALEPMVNLGADAVKVLGNGWTVVTKDGKWSAHFEDTVVITPGGCENLSRVG
jgi:methionyl aminopeptidase